MAIQGLTALCVVPARGGSKGIRKKNMRVVGGVSLVGRAAMLAKSLDWLDAAIVSTDDKQIAVEAKRYGLDAPFMRPAKLAGDLVTSIDTWKHALIASEEHYGKRFDISILLEPTSPMRRQDDVERSVEAMLSSEKNLSAATISRAPAHYTPHKTLTVDKNGQIGFYIQGGANYSIRQKIPKYYHRNGICYAVRRETLLELGKIIEERCAAVIIERPVVNIDDELDLEFAEFLLAREARS